MLFLFVYIFMLTWTNTIDDTSRKVFIINAVFIESMKYFMSYTVLLLIILVSEFLINVLLIWFFRYFISGYSVRIFTICWIIYNLLFLDQYIYAAMNTFSIYISS